MVERNDHNFSIILKRRKLTFQGFNKGGVEFLYPLGNRQFLKRHAFERNVLQTFIYSRNPDLRCDNTVVCSFQIRTPLKHYGNGHGVVEAVGHTDASSKMLTHKKRRVGASLRTGGCKAKDVASRSKLTTSVLKEFAQNSELNADLERSNYEHVNGLSG